MYYNLISATDKIKLSSK